MTNEPDRRPDGASRGSERADATRSRKAWKSPFVITGTDVEDTDHGDATRPWMPATPANRCRV